MRNVELGVWSKVLFASSAPNEILHTSHSSLLTKKNSSLLTKKNASYKKSLNSFAVEFSIRSACHCQNKRASDRQFVRSCKIAAHIINRQYTLFCS